MRLELVRSGEVVGGSRTRLVLRLRPQRVAQFAAFPGAQTVEREAKCDSNEPGAEALAVAKSIEPAVSPQQCFLGYIFGVGSVAQDAPRHAMGARAAVGGALRDPAAQRGRGRSVR